MFRLQFASSLALSCLAVLVAQPARTEPRAVIELFTSQGCSSCPAADKLIAEYSRDPSVIALSLAVDYWDYLGWKDTLALSGHSNRQRAYAKARGDREVYTPQVVVDGAVHALGSDKKPVYASQCEQGGTLDQAACPYGEETTSRANFEEWYHDIPGVNLPYLAYFYFQPQDNGLFLFASTSFFPLDNAGWQAPGVTGGDTAANGNDSKPHNFAFTTELHTKFKYTGGETFTFEGDDDLWVFMNKQLAIDLGGLHPALKGTVTLDDSATALGLVKGNTYPLDLFHAERHTTASHFRVQTTLSLVDCGSIPPDVPVPR